MIKINLLRDPFIQSAAKPGGKIEQTDMATPDAKPESKQTLPVVGILFCLIFSGFGGMYYLWLDKNYTIEEETNTELTEEKKKLEPYFKLEEQFREQKESLRKKEEVLTKLKKQQQLPVYFLQELANSLPDNLWFAKVTTKATKEGGTIVEINGESLSDDAIYQFQNNLNSRPQWFKNVKQPNVVRKDKQLEFTLTFDLMNPI